ncbi:MAG TPA: redoxin domain-containing protein [Pirellulaceae bacterium]|jgi:peroxiredoxin|nr:redoxin domain-containing protein [Pirellulaceae bacterium]
MHSLSRLSLSAILLAALGLVAGSPLTRAIEPDDAAANVPNAEIRPAIDFALVDLAGNGRDLRLNDRARVRAYVFLSTECPIANSYLPTLNRLHEALDAERVDLFGVLSDRSVTRAQAEQHFQEYQAKFPILFDSSGQLQEALGPTHVPEAFVLDADGKLVYRGSIDDVWGEIGRRKPQATKSWLADAIAAAVDGKPFAEARTTPVGCLVETWTPAESEAGVTYCRDVAPILRARCVDCHREGQVAPFPLESYEDAAKRAGQIVEVTHDRIMPPWVPSASHGKFVGDRRLTEAELSILKRWADGGRALGDEADLPPAPKFAVGWRMGEPDLVLEMPSDFEIPADGPDLMQNFVLPIGGLPEDKLVAAIEFVPGNPKVVHHCLLFLDDSLRARKLDAATPEAGYSRFGGPGFAPSGSLGGWSPGNTPRPLPNGMGRHIRKESDVVMQIHYHPTGKPETDRSRVGIYFVDEPVSEALKKPNRLVATIWASDYGLDIPAGESDYRRTTSYVLPRDVTMVGVVPHMHLLGKSMTATAILPSGEELTIIDVEKWDYNWQDEYYFERPFKLPKGTRLEATAAFDNSEQNPSNPTSPPKDVKWGDATDAEMMFCFFLITTEEPATLIQTVVDNLLNDRNGRKAAGLIR